LKKKLDLQQSYDRTAYEYVQRFYHELDHKPFDRELPYVQGDMYALDTHNEAWAGIVAFYCLIHIPHDSMVAVLNELKRALQSDGLLLLSFHIGAENLHLDELWDITVNMDFFFFTLDEIQRFLQTAGFEIEYARDRPPYQDVEYASQRGYVLARKPVPRPVTGSPNS
jgi:SAM-dependent methyltransferase